MNSKSVQEVSKPKYGKTDARYWKSRLYRNTYTRDGERVETADFCMKLAHAGRRETINLRTSNAEAAAAKARDLYQAVVKSGWPAALAIYKPQGAASASESPVTLKDLVTAADQRAVHVRPTTLRYYQGCLRQIAADVAGLERPDDLHDYFNGGSTRWREEVEAIPLSVITAEALRRWQTAYVKGRGTAPAEIRSAKVSANTIIGNAARMFTPVMLDHYKDAGLPVPGNPFAEVKPFPKQDSRYTSRMDPEAVLKAAKEKLQDAAPALPDGLTGVALANADLGKLDGPHAYRVILLGTMTGLRRSELDRLQWAHLDFAKGTLTVTSTADGDVKAQGSTRDVDLAPDLVAALRQWKAKSRSLYVIECAQRPGAKANKAATYRTYRCARVFDKAAAWLRDNFLPGENHPLHTLRKEYGSLITQSAGIHAAADLLGHRDIRTASEYYVVRKTRAFTGLAVPGAAPTTTVPAANLQRKRKAAQ